MSSTVSPSPSQRCALWAWHAVGVQEREGRGRGWALEVGWVMAQMKSKESSSVECGGGGQLLGGWVGG